MSNTDGVSDQQPSPQKKRRTSTRRAPPLDKRDLTDAELKRYAEGLWPAKPVEDIEELEALLDSQFLEYPNKMRNGSDDDDEEEEEEEEEEEDNDGDDDDIRWKNFSAYARKVGGFAWINALHAFGSDEDYDDDDDDDEDGDGSNGKPVMQSPLTYVLEREPEEWRFVNFLLQMGADPNVRNSRGEPPLFVFITCDSPMRRQRTFALLMEAGACERAVYRGKTMVEFGKMFKDNDQVAEMVWEYFRSTHGIMGIGDDSDDDDDSGDGHGVV